MYKLLVTIYMSRSPDNCALHSVVVEFNTKVEADHAAEAIKMEKCPSEAVTRDVIKLYW